MSKPFDQPIDTYAEIGGIELDVSVSVDYQPEESDTGTREAIEITEVLREGDGCVLHRMSDDEISALELRIFEGFGAIDDHHGDFLHDQRKDAELDSRGQVI